MVHSNICYQTMRLLWITKRNDLNFYILSLNEEFADLLGIGPVGIHFLYFQTFSNFNIFLEHLQKHKLLNP